jgi:hypothetical protein
MSARKTGSSTKVRRPQRKMKVAVQGRLGAGIAAGLGSPGGGVGPAARRQVMHDLGNSLGAARLHVRALAGTPLAADQRSHIDAALSEVTIAIEQLAQIRRYWEQRERRPRRGAP